MVEGLDGLSLGRPEARAGFQVVLGGPPGGPGGRRGGAPGAIWPVGVNGVERVFTIVL